MATAGPRAAGGHDARLALERRNLRHHRGPETGEVGRAGGEDELDTVVEGEGVGDPPEAGLHPAEGAARREVGDVGSLAFDGTHSSHTLQRRCESARWKLNVREPYPYTT